jgi:hypothetical protein
VLKKLKPAAASAACVPAIVESPVKPVREFENEVAAEAVTVNKSGTVKAAPTPTMRILNVFIKQIPLS